MPFGFHPLDLLVILVIALLIFGPRRLPEIGRTLGKTIRSFQNAFNEENEPGHKPVGGPPPSRSAHLEAPKEAGAATEENKPEEQAAEQHPVR